MKMTGREGGVGKIVVAILIVIILLLGLVIIGSIFSGDGGDGGEAPAQGEEGGEPGDEAVQEGPLTFNLTSILSILSDGDRLYIYGVKSIMDENNTQLLRKDHYIITMSLSSGEILSVEKIFEVPSGESDPISGQLVSVYSNRYVFGGVARERALIPFPLPLPFPFIFIEFGEIDLYYYIVEPGRGVVMRNTIEDIRGLGLGFYGDKYLTLDIDYEKMNIILRVYGLETGSVVFEAYQDASDFFYSLRPNDPKKLAYVERGEDMVRAVIVMSSVTEQGRGDIYIMYVEIDLNTFEFMIEGWPTKLVSAPLRLAYATAYLDGNDLYVYYSYDFLVEANETNTELFNRRDYQVEKWDLTSLTKVWSIEGMYTRTEDNASVGYVTSIYRDGVYYVSEAFIAAYRDGEELWRRNGWGGTGSALALFIPVTTYYGGYSFYEVGDRLYILWIERAESGGVVSGGIKMYRVSPDSEPIQVRVNWAGRVNPSFLINYRGRLYGIFTLQGGTLIFDEVRIQEP